MSSTRAPSNDVCNLCQQPNNDDMDDDYFAFADNNETYTSHMQKAKGNKCDLEVVQ